MSDIKYQIIEFSGETAPGQKSIDIVPFDWISFDEEANCLKDSVNELVMSK